MVLGHESCGAVKSAVKKLDVGSQNVTHLLSQIEPAIAKIPGERDYHNHEYMHEVILENVRLTVADIRARSKITADLEKEGKVKIVGAYYDLHTGKVEIVK
jgi:carbonic anhydrase